VTLFVPLLLIGVAIYSLTDMASIRTQARTALFKVPAAAALERARAVIRAARVPEQYRSIMDLKELEAAAARSNPILWLAALVALGFAVTREAFEAGAAVVAWLGLALILLGPGRRRLA